MYARGQEFDRIQAVIADAGTDQPLTAREILTLLDEHGELDENHENHAGTLESAHEVATVLGRQAQYGGVTVIRSSPYQYQIGGNL
ncbi:hypothetical protein SAMN05421858_2257 [Haladaptatus litoreus]|uniref:Uncharacterized protein n=1 Tax=Haladaptatus litoreus TaxID=553468 RepID=A0A1N7A0I5_9EURY|nr:hypothetical protein [Haladaptatus litoreus]SIR32509.1 hypothetical protein SAMN05421858_2257 [Haladaptatus litoreus]